MQKECKESPFGRKTPGSASDMWSSKCWTWKQWVTLQVWNSGAGVGWTWTCGRGQHMQPYDLMRSPKEWVRLRNRSALRAEPQICQWKEDASGKMWPVRQEESRKVWGLGNQDEKVLAGGESEKLCSYCSKVGNMKTDLCVGFSKVESPGNLQRCFNFF